jgi:hypothetical protein
MWAAKEVAEMSEGDATPEDGADNIPDASKNTKRTYGKPFEKGNRASPGRPQGSRNSATIMAEKLMQDGIDNIVKTVMEAAAQGDMTAARLVLERVVPVRRGRPVNLTLGPIETADGVSKAVSATVQAMADGELTPDEAATVTGVLEAKRKVIETGELEERLTRIEAKLGVVR